MAKFVMLGNWTEKGTQNVNETLKRARGVRELFASMGVNAREFFWTLGQYDVVLTFDAPDDETMMRATLAVVKQGYLKTTTLRALGEQEMERVLAELK
ncbi:MAG TPA: GYD domain-containing protein [Casimicrobiaceae bacterium]|nr:GYD domain-containing protein [Casimicrobiaceae bacterium]